MKLHPEDPRLTAYILGELPQEDAAAVEQAAQKDSAIQTSLDELQELSGFLAGAFAPPQPYRLRPAQRQSVIHTARNPGSTDNVIKINDHRKSWKPWIASLAAAALLIFALFLFSKAPIFSPTVTPVAKYQGSEKSGSAAAPGNEEWRTLPNKIALLPAPGPTDASRVARGPAGGTPATASTLEKAAAARDEALAKSGGTYFQKITASFKGKPLPPASELPALTRRGSVVASITPQLQLPVQAGSASMDWVAHSIREDRKLPPTDAVRVEEILNRFPLQPAGTASLSQGVTLSTETLPCPWKPSASLLIVALRGAADGDREIQATFKADPANVARYRLLGFAPVSGIPEGSLPTHLPAKALTLVAIEIEPNLTATQFGTVEWSVNRQPAPPIPLTRHADAEPSDDARFASLLCAYAQWLAGEQAGIIDDQILAALAREMAADNLPADRFDLLNLIDQSLKL